MNEVYLNPKLENLNFLVPKKLRPYKHTETVVPLVVLFIVLGYFVFLGFTNPNYDVGQYIVASVLLAICTGLIVQCVFQMYLANRKSMARYNLEIDYLLNTKVSDIKIDNIEDKWSIIYNSKDKEMSFKSFILNKVVATSSVDKPVIDYKKQTVYIKA